MFQTSSLEFGELEFRVCLEFRISDLEFYFYIIMTKQIYGIIGHPVEHSLSPAMQNAAFKALGIEAEYKVFDVKPEELENFLKDAVKNNIAGFNITIPHKINAKEYIEKNGVLDENAKRLGAVNTVKIVDVRLNGHNTDGPGFYRSLVGDLKFEPEGRRIFVLGAGGAAHAIIMYLGNGPRKIYFTDIDKTKCAGLKDQYKKYYDSKKLEMVNEENLAEGMKDSELLINATPIGMKESDPLPIDKEMLHPGLRIYDLVYNRPVTALVREANMKKLHAVTGLGMLLYQGAIAFEIWTGKKAPIDVMRKALREALKNKI